MREVQRFYEAILKRIPWIKKLLRMANMPDKPVDFIKKAFILSSYAAFGFAVLLFFVLDKLVFPEDKGALLLTLLVFMTISFSFTFMFVLYSPKVHIRRRQREINQEVLFAGRYILVKLDSGIPLYNTLIDASRSYGICAKYFKEIVDNIRIGTPIEQALNEARELTPSKYFKLILTELITSLKTGVDVSIALREVLGQITREQVIEIKEYGKKLNAFMMMYMVLATVMPSLGVTMFIVIAGFMGLTMGPPVIFAILFLLTVMQFFFLAMLRSMRPMVNL
ncbi:MAG: type II secretion system F family protein [Nanobdellota archaeon]